MLLAPVYQTGGWICVPVLYKLLLLPAHRDHLDVSVTLTVLARLVLLLRDFVLTIHLADVPLHRIHFPLLIKASNCSV